MRRDIGDKGCCAWLCLFLSSLYHDWNRWPLLCGNNLNSVTMAEACCNCWPKGFRHYLVQIHTQHRAPSVGKYVHSCLTRSINLYLPLDLPTKLYPPTRTYPCRPSYHQDHSPKHQNSSRKSAYLPTSHMHSAQVSLVHSLLPIFCLNLVSRMTSREAGAQQLSFANHFPSCVPLVSTSVWSSCLGSPSHSHCHSPE